MRMNAWIADLRHALRGILRRPGFALAAIVTLALGIGVTAASFALVETVLLRPLPFDAAGRLVTVRAVRPEQGIDRFDMSPPDAGDLVREPPLSLEGVAVYNWGGLQLRGEEHPVELTINRVNPGFFDVVGIPPAQGRAFTEAEQREGARSVILSHATWRDRLGSRPDIVGSQVTLDGEPWTVIGVMPEWNRFPDESVEAFALLDAGFFSSAPRGARFVNVLGRLRPGRTHEQLAGELAAFSRAHAQAYPDTNKGWHALARPLKDELTDNAQPALTALMAIAGLLLLIACLNVANMLLMRSLRRGHEYGVLSAIGATGGRLARTLALEGLWLTLGGAATGAVLAWLLLAMVRAFGDQVTGIPRLEELGSFGTVFAINVGVSLVAVPLFAAVPALRLARRGPDAALRHNDPRQIGGGRTALQAVLSSSAVALAVVLVLGTGLLLRSLQRLSAVPLGYDPTQTTSVQYFRSEGEPARWLEFNRAVVEAALAVPGVGAAGMTSSLPLSPINNNGRYVVVAGRPEPEPFPVGIRSVLGDYFGAMRIPLKGGRFFDADEEQGSVRSALVNETFVRMVLAGADPIGREFSFSVTDPRPVRIVGVVGDIRHGALAESPMPEFYVPYGLGPTVGVSLVARHAPVAGIARALEQVVWDRDSNQGLYRTVALDDSVQAALGPPRFYTRAALFIGGVALLLACINLYAVLAQAVTQRTAEFGIRRALGAPDRAIVRDIAWRAGAIVAAGLALGLGAGIAGGRVVSALLYDTATYDPLALSGVAVVLTLVGALAALAPLRRALAVEPMRALRYE
jgi:putative ABC transport system permease protein